MLIAPVPDHRCRTPDSWEFHTPETLWQCGDCEQWWVAHQRRDSARVCWAPGVVDWYPVTWWNRKARKRIRGAS